MAACGPGARHPLSKLLFAPGDRLLRREGVDRCPRCLAAPAAFASSATQPTFESDYNAVRRSEPDVIGSMHAGGDLINFVKQFNQAGLKGKTTLAVGLVGVAIAFLLGLTAILVFTSFGWRGRLGTHWVHVATLGSMLVWLGLLAMFFAGFGVGNTVSDEIPPYIGRSSSVGELLQMLAFAAFLTTIVGAIASLVLAFRSAGVARRAWHASR